MKKKVQNSNPPVNPTTSTSASGPLLSHTETQEFLRLAFEKIIQASPIQLSPDDVGPDPDLSLSERNISSDEVEDLSSQFDSLGQINAAIVLHDPDSANKKYTLLTGAKRLGVAEHLKRQLWCRCIQVDLLFPLGISEEKKKALLQELAMNLTYSESALSTSVNDYSIYKYFLTLRNAHDFKKHDFKKVMPLIGLAREHGPYRNLKRIWDVVCCQPAVDLIEDEGRVHLSVIKRDENIRPLEQPQKAAQIIRRIKNYTNKLRMNAPKDDQKKQYHQLKSYKSYEITRMIVEEDLPGLSPQNWVMANYSQPKVKIKRDDKRLIVPSVTLDLSDPQPNNVRKIVEAAFKLKEVGEFLYRIIGSIAPKNPGDEAKRMQVVPQIPVHNDDYIKIIEQYNMHAYANLEKVANHFRDKLYPLADEASAKKLSKDARIAKYYNEFVHRTVCMRQLQERDREKVDVILDNQVRARSKALTEVATDAQSRDKNVKGNSKVSKKKKSNEQKTRTKK